MHTAVQKPFYTHEDLGQHYSVLRYLFRYWFAVQGSVVFEHQEHFACVLHVPRLHLCNAALI